MAVNLFRHYESIVRNELRFITGDEEETMEISMDILLASYSVEGLRIADSLDFNQRELRCAYLLLFSTSHSHMVLEALNKLHEENCTEFLNLIFSAAKTHGSFNITSLGGGPGSDPLGILTFLDEKGFLESCPTVKVSVVDEYIGWESMFRQVMEKFNNGSVRAHFTTQDLLGPLSTEVETLLRRTHFLSMVKFVSAISGDKLGAVSSFQRIFSLLQPGTIILIIDNAGGPDFKQVFTWAEVMGLKPILEPILHHQFKVPKTQEQGLGRIQYGKRPQSSSTISIVILKKYGSSFINYNEPVIDFEENNLLQPRRQRSNGYQNGSSSCRNDSDFETLPPILGRLLLASEYRNRSNKNSNPSVAPSSSGSSYFGLNTQSTTQKKPTTSSTPSLYGINRPYLQSSQANPSGSTYNGLIYQSGLPSIRNNPSISSVYGINQTYLTSTQPKQSGPIYSGLSYQSNAQSRATSQSTSSFNGVNQTYFDRAPIQGNIANYRREIENNGQRPYSEINLSRRTTPLSKKQESKCCLL